MQKALVILISSLISCSSTDRTGKNLTIRDIEIFKNTPAWELAREVKSEDQSDIKAIARHSPALMNYQESKFGTTLLMWAVSMEKYKAVSALLESGANPNIRSNSGATALFKAVSFSWLDNGAKTDARFVELLLKHHADPNIVYTGITQTGSTSPIAKGTSPLMHAVSRSFEKTKALVEGGASIDYKTETDQNAAIVALMMEKVDAAYYLIVEEKADVSAPYYFYRVASDTIDREKKYYPADLLRTWIYDLDSEAYLKKMAIVEELRRQGQDYRSTKIHERIVDQIKKLHPGEWQEYLDKY